MNDRMPKPVNLMIKDDYKFLCPHCGTALSISLDVSGGRKQYWVYDCEICCRPIYLEIEMADGEVIDFKAKTGH